MPRTYVSELLAGSFASKGEARVNEIAPSIFFWSDSRTFRFVTELEMEVEIYISTQVHFSTNPDAITMLPYWRCTLEHKLSDLTKQMQSNLLQSHSKHSQNVP